MTKEKFTAILKEYDFQDTNIEKLWNDRPTDDIDEDRLRTAAMKVKQSRKNTTSS